MRNENGGRLVVSWFKQTHQDREAGQGFKPFPRDDDNFEFSGVTIVTDDGNFSQNSNLTITSLTDELDNVIIICRFDEPEAEFTLRIYRTYILFIDIGLVTSVKHALY